MSTTLSADQIVEKLRNWIQQGKSDHWLGMQARLLIAPRTAPGPGRISFEWEDTGSGPGHGTAWERPDDPEQS